MASNLLIVESPAKAVTLKKYLGKDFEVLASYGHVRDLVPKTGAVDPDDDFRMKYELIDRNAKHVDAITKAVKESETVLLATDPDREGEAIAWHLAEILKSRKALKDRKLKRVVFYGVVQGVGFRPTAYRVARAMGLHGYVRNNGSNVEVVVDGKAADASRPLPLRAGGVVEVSVRVRG